MVSLCDSYAYEDKSGIRVAQYLTELPSKEVLLCQLQKSLAFAKDLSTERWAEKELKNNIRKTHKRLF